ncbi:hypothetical protein Indivirus_15_4 [Indivirus ILV1]|uniref:Uncharacterized protein n=1 Tax=Indivirus ILV1 TaxID=1977633 RepID=A0A1V0SEP5_9VIRU|nr:hypothetical protein Indivirus_15_4 [Indivirus ILV1]
MEESVLIFTEPIDRRTYMNHYMKEYRKNNNERYTVKERCDICDCEINKSNKTHHIKTKKHKMNEMIIQMKELENSMKLMLGK